MISTTRTVALLVCSLTIVCSLASQTVEAGCPFDDGSCQEYCNQQGCNLGYCGHFAWIQCICRRCGDEWNWYDKVHYNPDKQVNQTELDSLKLNASAPLILTNNNAKLVQETTATPPTTDAGEQQVNSGNSRGGQQRLAANQQQAAPTKQQDQKVMATLTTLLIPDLSDGSKLDLNDIPDENSEKFLDYLTKNHEKLVQATNSDQHKQSPSSARSTDNDNEGSKGIDGDADNDDADAEQQVTTPNSSSDGEPQADEAIEIQISSSNNNQPSAQQQTTASTTTTVVANNKSGGARSLATDDEADDGEQQASSSGPMMRLLRMAVSERSSDDIF